MTAFGGSGGAAVAVYRNVIDRKPEEATKLVFFTLVAHEARKHFY